MAAYIPSSNLEVHPNFNTSYEEDKFMKDNGCRTRQSFANWTIAKLKDQVGIAVWSNWDGNVVNTGRRATYANYLAHTKIEQLYVFAFVSTTSESCTFLL